MAYYKQDTTIWLDGRFYKAGEVQADLYGQTLHYGYGAFEGIRSYDTAKGARIFKSKEHYERLQRSCALLGIPFNWDIDALTATTYELLERNNLRDAYIRPLVFCDPNMTLIRPKGVHIFIAVWDWGAYLGEKLLRITLSPFCRPHPKSTFVEAKACGHYINSILAGNEARDRGFDEALLLDCDGYLAEGPGANLFFEKDGTLYTPQLGNILPGVTRATVIELCQDLDIPVKEGLFRPELLQQADSAFFCGTGAEIVGIRQIDDYTFPKPWEESIGAALREAYLNLVREKPYLVVDVD